MAKSFITSDYDSWLYDNYPNKSNKELAAQLTSMIGKENKEQLERLYRMRPLITQTTLRQTLERQIAWRERFTKVTENMVKKAAMRLAGLRKSPLFLSSANRNKARTTNVRKWKQQAKPVDNADKWLRSFHCREVRICRLDNPGDIRRIRNAVNNFNRLESLSRGITFITELIREANLLRVVATPRYTWSNEYTRQIDAYQKQIDEYNKRLDALANRIVDANTKIANIQAVEPEYSYTPTGDSAVPSTPSTGGSGSGGHSGHGGDSVNTKHEETYLEKQAKIHEQNILRLQIAYMKGEQNYEEYVNAMEAEDKRYYEDVTTNTQVGESDRLKLQKEYLEKSAEYENKRRAKSLQEVEDEYKDLNVKAMQNYVSGKLNKEEYEETINRLELESLQKKRNVLNEQIELMKKQNQSGSQQYAELSKSYAEANKEYLDKMIADQEEKARKAKEIEEKELEERQRLLRERNQSLQSIRDEYFGMNAYRAKQEYDAMMKLLDEQKAIELAEVSNLENADAEKLRIEEAYQKARLALAKKYNQLQEEDNRNFMQKWNDSVKSFLDSELGKAVTGTMDVVTSSMKNIFTQLTTIITAEAEIETAKVERLYDQRISLAEGNNYKVTRLEKQKEERIAKIKNEAEKKKYKMEVISAIAQTAQGAINAYSSAAAIPLVGYIIAPVAAAAAIAAGMLQVQALKKQQQASEAQGYAEGGFTPDGLPDTPAGIVHAGEWVASQRLTKNRRIRPILEALDTAQRTNNVGSLSDEYVTKTITAPTVLAESFKDYRQAPKKVIVENQPTQTQSPQSERAFADYAETMRLLRQRLDEPFVTVNSVTGDIGMKQAQDEYAKLIRNKTPKSRR